MKYVCNIAAAALLTTSLSACVPLAILGGAGAVGYTASQERSVGNAVDDAGIEAAIYAKFAGRDDSHLFKKVSADSVEGRVLLTGNVPSNQAKVKVYNLVSEVNNVQEVYNELKVDENTEFSIRERASDAWISTQIESRLLFTKDIKSRNYSIETIHGVVYLMGVAQSREELSDVTSIASEVAGVARVVSYVRIKGSSANVSGNPVPVTEEPLGTVPGSAQSQKQWISPQPENSYQSGDIIIEESPNAQ